MTNVEKRIIELILAEVGLESIFAEANDGETKSESVTEVKTLRKR